jgi:hypothetical protein
VSDAAPERPSRPKMYVIEEIWRDSLENQVDSAIGYKPVAVCLYETTAKRVVREGGTVDETYCWAVMRGTTMPKYRYKEVPVWV